MSFIVWFFGKSIRKCRYIKNCVLKTLKIEFEIKKQLSYFNECLNENLTECSVSKIFLMTICVVFNVICEY